MRVLIERINLLRKEKKYDDIIEIISNDERKENEEIQIILAEIYAESGNFEKSVEIMNKVVERNENKKNLIKRSVFLFKMNEKVKALEDVERAYEMDREDPNTMKGVIDVNAAIGNYERSLDVLEILGKNPNFNDGSLHERRRNLINMLKMREESDYYLYIMGVIKALVKNEDKLFIAQKMFEDVKERKDDKYYEIGAVLYRRLNNTKKIIEICEEAISKGEKYVNDKVYKALAFALIDNGKLKDAIKIYEEIIEKYPNDKDLFGIYSDMSFAYYNLEENVKALEIIEKAIEIMPSKEFLYMRRGDIKARVYGIEQAIMDYERAIELNPLNKEAYERKDGAVAILYRQGRKNEGEGIFR